MRTHPIADRFVPVEPRQGHGMLFAALRKLGDWWRSEQAQRRLAQEAEALLDLDDHMLKDIGASDSVRALASVVRERREDPFAAISTRGIDSAMRRLDW